MKKPVCSVLILSGSFGHGHNTAAHNLATAFRRRLPDGVVEVADFFGDAYPRIDGLLREGYGFAINRTSSIWKQLYRMADMGGSGWVPYLGIRGKLKRYIARRRPDVVVSTFPFFPMLVGQIYPDRKAQPFGFYTVITDAITINAIWWQGYSDRLFVTDRWSQEVVEKEGIPAERLRAHGFPLAPRGEDGEKLADLPEAAPKILYLPTTKVSHVRETLEVLVRWCAANEGSLTLVLGTHEGRLGALAKAVTEALPAGRCVVHGWRDDVPALMRQHHLLVTKAGGATVAEALGAECPVVLNYVVPGQEEGNAELIKRCECGVRVHSPEELEGALNQVLIVENGALWSTMRNRLKALEGGEASDRIVEDILRAATLTK